MGPTLIFDKSTLESLNIDEAVWLDNFFLCNITPLFYIETLADLEKQVRTGRTAEQIVGSLAVRTPDGSSKCNVHHQTLLEGELFGQGTFWDGSGRPIISRGRAVELDGKTGIIFQPSPEEEAFARWQRGEFLDLERNMAKAWRKGLAILNLEENYQFFQRFLPLGKPKSFADVKRFAEFYVDGPDGEAVMRFGLSMIGLVDHAQEQVIERWQSFGKPKLGDFAPYFRHVMLVDLVFNIGIAADLVGRGRPSHKVDLAYLYYLPFCMVFTSNDKLHAELVPLFLRENQTFVPGAELKADLGRLDAYYDRFPDDIKIRGVISFAHYPPQEGAFLVARLWDQHISPKWREQQVVPKPQPNSPVGKKIMEEIRRFEKEGAPVADSVRVSSDEADRVVLKRMVAVRKGKWTRFPPEVLNRRKNENGEWEDIA